MADTIPLTNSLPVNVGDCNLLTEIKRALNLPLDPIPIDGAAHQVIAKARLESTVALASEIDFWRKQVSSLKSKLAEVSQALGLHERSIKDIIQLTK